MRRAILLAAAAVALLAVLSASYGSGATPNLQAALWDRARKAEPGAPPVVLDFSQLAPFRWTRVYFFGPGTDSRQIEGRLGFRWVVGGTEAPSRSGSRHLVLFTDGPKVVRELFYGNRQPQLDCLEQRSFTRARARFLVALRAVPWRDDPLRVLVPAAAGNGSHPLAARYCLLDQEHAGH